MDLRCPSCLAIVPQEQVHDLGVAQCTACGTTFEPGDDAVRSERARDAVDKVMGSLTEQIARPARVREHRDADGLVLSVLWISPTRMIEVGAMWFMLALFPLTLIDMLAAQEGDPVAFAVIYAVPTLAVLYYTVANVVNRTALTANAHGLAVEHGPLPWFGAELLRWTEVDALLLDRTSGENRGRYGNRHTWRVHHLMALLRDGTEVKLLGWETDASVPRYLKQELEARFLRRG